MVLLNFWEFLGNRPTSRIAWLVNDIHVGVPAVKAPAGVVFSMNRDRTAIAPLGAFASPLTKLVPGIGRAKSRGDGQRIRRDSRPHTSSAPQRYIVL